MWTPTRQVRAAATSRLRIVSGDEIESDPKVEAELAAEQARRRALWLGRAVVWLRGHERHFLADNLSRCEMAGVGFSFSHEALYKIVTLTAEPEVEQALRPFSVEGEDAWVRRAFTATDPWPIQGPTKIRQEPAEVRWRRRTSTAVGSRRLAGTLVSPGQVEFNGMRFRSFTETRIAQALDDANVLYFPLPAAVRHHVKFEVDFLVVHQGRVGVLEVDGPTHTPTTRAREDSRAAWFEKSGIALFRHYPVAAVDDDPAAVVADFLSDLRGPRF